MWFRGAKSTLQKFIVLIFALKVFKGCEAITNADFNAQIRNYSEVDDIVNLTDVKTLQKHGLGLSRYAGFAPVQSPVKFKDVPDNILSETGHARGLLHHGHTGYGFEYEDPHYGNGYEYQPHDSHDHHDQNNYHHYDFHDGGHHHSPAHHHGYGHHHKYYDHGLTHKALLWPIAGIALLGAAAALVTNPVLLQLGVVSGKRKRRHIDEIENIARDSIKKWSQMANYKNEEHNDNAPKKVISKKMLRREDLQVVKQVLQSGKRAVQQFEPAIKKPQRYSEEDRRFIPIPLKIKKP